jgi:hypothetical protein
VRLLFATVLVAACTGADAPPRPDVGFYVRLFGQTPNAGAVLRVADTLRDPFYGPYARRALDKAGVKPGSLSAVLSHTEEIDLALSVTKGVRSDDLAAVIVVYGVPDDPATVREDDEVLFRPSARLPSGVSELTVEHDKHFALFALRNVWVLAHGDAIDRTRNALSASASPPPRLGVEESALSVMWANGSALEGRELDRETLDGPARIIADSLDEGELVVTRSAKGDIISRFWMEGEDAAKLVESELHDAMDANEHCDSTCRMIRAIVTAMVDVRRDGKYVRVRLHVPEILIRKLAE